MISGRTLVRASRMAIDNFRRNVWLSVVTVLILVVSLVLFSFVLGFNVLTHRVTTTLNERVDLTVNYKPTANQSTVTDLERRLGGLDGVRSVTHVTAEENLATFRERHRDDPDIQETLKQFATNPFGASSVVVARDAEAYRRALTAVQDPAYTTVVDTTENSLTTNARIIDSVGNFLRRFQRFALGSVFLFFLIALLVVFNTLWITIYIHRDEIAIMRLVGASNGFIRAPFVIEALLYALAATIVAFLVIVPLIQSIAPWLDQWLQPLFLTSNSLVTYFNGHLWQTFVFELLASLVLTGGSALIAVGRYIRV